MNIQKAKNNSIWFFTMVMFSSVFLLVSASWGRYILLLSVLLITLLTIHRWKYHYVLEEYHFFLLAFACYAFLSAVWAWSTSDAISKGISTTEILVFMFILYNHYSRFDNVEQLYDVIKIASYVVVIYSIYYYGIDFIRLMVAAGTRLENSYINVNSLGMLAATGVVIQVNQIVRKKKKDVFVLGIVPSVFMIAATQSRKALVVLAIGVIASLYIEGTDRKKFLNKLISAVAILTFCAVGVWFVLRLPIFEGVLERMQGVIAMITGKGNLGRSAEVRSSLVAIGMKQFAKTPIVGIGIGCPHILAKNEMEFDAYLHNNYVELLAGGGIIGFLIYYGMYVFLFLNLWKYRKCKSKTYNLTLILIIVQLIVDYGAVSCYEKNMFFYLMIFFLDIKNMEKRTKLAHKGIKNEYNTMCP